MQPDSTIRMTGALIQHGPANDRVYLMKLASSDVPRIIRFMEQLAFSNGYSKLFAKIPEHAEGWFHASGFKEEARVPSMFGRGVDGCFMAKYPRPKRARLRHAERVQEILRTADARAGHMPEKTLPPGWSVSGTGPDDAHDMAGLYREVFETYPFPIHDPDYLRSTMASHVRYFAVRDAGGRLAALSSAEMDVSGGNAEMTDFATRSEYRGKGLAGLLLSRMEEEMRAAGIRTAYTIARANSAGMNIVFARQGYAFAGILPNNTQIKGALESMNVWYKRCHAGKETI